MIDPRSRLQLLKNMDISLWEKRSTLLFLDKPLACAKLAVLLDKPLKRQDTEEKKVLLGMLNVLELKKEEYWIGWQCLGNEALIKQKPELEAENLEFRANNLEFVAANTEFGAKNKNLNLLDTFWHTMKSFMPRAVLLLGENWIDVLGGSEPSSDLSIHFSFHPGELIKTPEKKKKAFQTLLNLKKTL